MPSFAERMGHRAGRSIVQTDSLDDDTRVALWNIMNTHRNVLEGLANERVSDTYETVLGSLWRNTFQRPADEQPQDHVIWREVKQIILHGEWFDALDLVETVVRLTDRAQDYDTRDIPALITEAYNRDFEQFLVGYRFIGLEITPIDTTEQAEAVAEAVEASAVVSGAQHHLGRAVALLADRQQPDYPNVIKESVSAVESVCRAVTGEKTLGAALSKLEGAGVPLHGALKSAWAQMYGWASDGPGIRHGQIDAPDADQALAKYVLVTCSAFVTYVVEAGRKAGLL